MFKKFPILTFFVLIASFGNAQVKSVVSKKFSPDELREDAQIVISDLKACHPKLYAYTTSNILDSLSNSLVSSLTDSLTQEEFHLRVRKYLVTVGCGHTSAKPSDEWYAAMRGNISAIPIHVVLFNDEFYIQNVFADDADSLIGARIISVDDVSASSILEELSSIVERDGKGTTLLMRNIERLFQTYYLFAYGTKAQYSIEMELQNGRKHSVLLEGKNPVRHSIDENYPLYHQLSGKDATFGFLDSANTIAVLDLNSFASSGYRKFYRKSFKQLSSSDSETLIVDLRGNGGGYFPNGNRLLSYLMNEKFSMDFSRPKKQPKRSKYVKTNCSSKMTRLIFATIPDRNEVDEDRNYQIVYKPIKRNHFSGSIYVITDGLSFSASGFVSSKLKNAGRAEIVGEETGGGEVTFNAVLQWKLSLPNTHLHIAIPMYHIDVQPEMKDLGRGVMPTIPVEYENSDQRVLDIDLEIQRILELLSTNY